MFKTILVHVDLSAHAIAHQARLPGAAMFGVSRTMVPLGYGCGPGTLEASCFDPRAQNARRALARLDGITPRLHVSVPRRAAGHDLPDLAAERDRAMLVVGRYGHGKLRGLCQGGAGSTVLADVRIPVLLAH
jgi:nucleotide-binding universal stress UspA family protein